MSDIVTPVLVAAALRLRKHKSSGALDTVIAIIKDVTHGNEHSDIPSARTLRKYLVEDNGQHYGSAGQMDVLLRAWRGFDPSLTDATRIVIKNPAIPFTECTETFDAATQGLFNVS